MKNTKQLSPDSASGEASGFIPNTASTATNLSQMSSPKPPSAKHQIIDLNGIITRYSFDDNGGGYLGL